MSEQPKVIAWMMDAPIADDDPYRHIKLRARDIGAAAEILDQAARAVDCDQRAAAIGQVVEALAVESIDAAELLDASGLSEQDREDACHVALTLRLAELGELGDDG